MHLQAGHLRGQTSTAGLVPRSLSPTRSEMEAPDAPQRPLRPRAERHLGRAFAAPCGRAGPGLHFPACRWAERPRPAVSGSRRLIAAAADEPSPRAGGGAAGAAPCRRPAHYARPGGWRWKVRAPRPQLAVPPRGPSPVSSPGRSPAAGPARADRAQGEGAALGLRPRSAARLASPAGPARLGACSPATSPPGPPLPAELRRLSPQQLRPSSPLAVP